MIGDEPRELDLVRQQQRLPAGGDDVLDLDAGVVRPEGHDEAVGRAAPERDRYPMARHDVERFGHGVRVGLAVEASCGLDGYFGVEQVLTSSGGAG